jgi:hypothetical protein
MVVERGCPNVILLSFVPILLVILVVCIVLFAFFKRQGNMEGGEAEVKTIYIYVVLFATLMMTIGGGIGVFMALSDLVSPPNGYYQTFENYKMEQKKMAEPDAAKTPAKTDAELKASYEEMVKSEKERTKANALNSLIKSLGFIIIPFPIFIYYQRRLKTQTV